MIGKFNKKLSNHFIKNLLLIYIKVESLYFIKTYICFKPGNQELYSMFNNKNILDYSSKYNSSEL